MLGLDWLQNQGCVWDFNARTIRVGNKDFTLFDLKPNYRVRRVVLYDDATIPAFAQKIVKASTVYSRLKFDEATWATEAVEITRGVRVARALVKYSPNDVIRRVLGGSSRCRYL